MGAAERRADTPPPHLSLPHISAALHHSAAVGPFASPTETYQYFDLPFCQPKTKDNKPLTLGEASLPPDPLPSLAPPPDHPL